MPAVKLRLAQGTPCWVSLMTDDLAGARAFYGELFGWTYTPGPAQLGAYVRAELAGAPVAGLGVAAVPGFPVRWTTYFAVDNADQVTQRVRECGGTVAVGPLQAERAGRLAIAADLDGAVFGLWQGEEHLGHETSGEPGEPVWTELLTPEPESAAAFYGMVFGLPVTAGPDGPGGPGQNGPGQDGAGQDRAGQDGLLVDGRPVAGITGEAPHGRPPRWRIHFAVHDVELTARRAVELGGRVLAAPYDTPRGRVARLADPRGGRFAVLES
ncbi:VOC family protein [Kitasatospora sp. NPDC004240]